MADGSAAENAWDMDGGGPCRVRSFHHIQFHVSNALQASFWYCFHFGFERFAQRQSNQYSEVAIRNGSIIFLFKSPISPEDPQKVGGEIAIHGDFVKDVAYSVDNLDFVLEHLTRCGHRLLEAKKEVRDADGSLLIARIAGSAGSIVHTLVQNIDYRGHFMPLFKPARNFTFCQSLMPISFCQIDHVVEAHPEHTLDNVSVWYKRMLRFHRFWSIDDKLVHTKFSALNAVLMGNDETLQPNVKITLVEPVQVNGRKRRGQVQEFLDFHGTSGVQHIAFQTDDIVAVVEKLRGRGVEFLPIPHSYYDLLKSRLSERENDTNCKQPQPIEEDLSKIRELGILMDFDERGYLLQIFTKPVQDRATLFLEIIQRHNFNGFGAGNFKALFEAVEMEQRRREEEETTD